MVHGQKLPVGDRQLVRRRARGRPLQVLVLSQPAAASAAGDVPRARRAPVPKRAVPPPPARTATHARAQRDGQDVQGRAGLPPGVQLQRPGARREGHRAPGDPLCRCTCPSTHQSQSTPTPITTHTHTHHRCASTAASCPTRAPSLGTSASGEGARRQGVRAGGKAVASAGCRATRAHRPPASAAPQRTRPPPPPLRGAASCKSTTAAA